MVISWFLLIVLCYMQTVLLVTVLTNYSIYSLYGAVSTILISSLVFLSNCLSIGNILLKLLL